MLQNIFINLLEITAVNDIGKTSNKTDKLIINPISQATMVLIYEQDNIHNDPIGGTVAFKGVSKLDIVLKTDIYNNLIDLKTLKASDLSRATLSTS